MLLGSDAFDNLGDDMVKRADIILRRGNVNVVSPRDRALRDLAQMYGGGNINPRIRSKSNPLPPDKTGFVLAKWGRASGEAPSGWDAVKTRALAEGAALDVSRPERGTNGPLDLIRKSAEGPPLVSERSSWGDTRPARRGREVSGYRDSIRGLKIDGYFSPRTIKRRPNRGPFEARVKVNDGPE
jgi:hypothetical protein